jgi:hypothetical protein
MFWWIVLAIVVTFGVAFLIRITPVGLMLGALLAAPFGLLFGTDFKDRGAISGTFANLFVAFIACFAGLVLGGLILSHHTALGWYWILCVPVAIIWFIAHLTFTNNPVSERTSGLYMEAWPNLMGCAGAVVACYYLVRPWFKM